MLRFLKFSVVFPATLAFAICYPAATPAEACTNILVTTDSGIYMHDFSELTPWINLAEIDASVYGQLRGPLR